MAIPAAAAAAYRAAAQMGSTAAASSVTPATVPGGSFSDFLSGAVKDSINTIRQGEQAATAQVQGKANLVDVATSVAQTQVAVEGLVAVRDKVISSYQSIMQMPI